MRTPSFGIDQNQDGSFIDKYWGRVPQMIHSIPEADIWDCNPEYIYLINGVIAGTIMEDNLSNELYADIMDLLNAVGGSRPLTIQEVQLLHCAGMTNAPGIITNLSATDDLRGSIIVTWEDDTSAIPYPTFDMYEDGLLIASDVKSPYTVNVWDVTRDYHVVATNIAGTNTSNTDSGTSLPEFELGGPIIDLDASDNRIGAVMITWSHANVGSPACTYNLFEDNILVEYGVTSPHDRTVGTGTRDYHVEAVNAQGVVVSNIDSGESLAIPVGPIPEGPPKFPTLFTASDDQIGQVTCTWKDETEGNPVATYDLYEDNIMVATGIVSPYVHAVAQGTREYFVMAVNIHGDASSSSDSGTSEAVKTAPVPITNLEASDTLVRRIVVTWDLDTVTYPEVKYRLFRNNELIAEDVQPGFIDRDVNYFTFFFLTRTYNYELVAYNSEGAVNATDTGTAQPNCFINLILPDFGLPGFFNGGFHSVTHWLESQVFDPECDMRLTNPFQQPSLIFDGLKPIFGHFLFENDAGASVTGTNSGDDAIKLGYDVEIKNLGTFRGAGGKGGEGASVYKTFGESSPGTLDHSAVPTDGVTWTMVDYNVEVVYSAVATEQMMVRWTDELNVVQQLNTIGSGTYLTTLLMFGAGREWYIGKWNDVWSIKEVFNSSVGGDGGEGASYTNPAALPGQLPSDNMSGEGGSGGEYGETANEGAPADPAAGSSTNPENGQTGGSAISGKSHILDGSLAGIIIGDIT